MAYPASAWHRYPKATSVCTRTLGVSSPPTQLVHTLVALGYRVFKNTEFYGGGRTSENSLNEPAELSLRCLAKTENDHCAAPCDTGVRDVGIAVAGRVPDDAIQRQGLVGLRPGRPREGPPCPTRSQSVLRHPPLAWGAALCGGPPPGDAFPPG